MLEKHMEQFEKDLGLEGLLRAKIEGTYEIPVGDGIILSVQNFPGGFTFFSEFMKIPESNKEDIYRELLTANLFGINTKDALIGLNQEGNMLTISRTVDYNIDYKGFKEMIEDFMTTIDFWKEKIQEK